MGNSWRADINYLVADHLYPFLEDQNNARSLAASKQALRGSSRFFRILPNSLQNLMTVLVGVSSGAMLVTNLHQSGVKWALVLAALLSAKKCFLITGFQRCEPDDWLSRIKYCFTHRMLQFSIKRVVRKVQVFSEWECEYYAELFGIADPELFVTVPYPVAPRFVEQKTDQRNGVLVAGHTLNDFETVIAVFADLDIPLTFVCSSRERRRVEQLVGDRNIPVLSDVPLADYQGLLKQAEVNLIALREGYCSCGLNRLRDSAETSTPVLVTHVKGVEEYVEHERNVLIHKTGDADDLRRQIRRLLDSTDLGSALAEQLARDFLPMDGAHYAAELRRFVSEAS